MRNMEVTLDLPYRKIIELLGVPGGIRTLVCAVKALGPIVSY
jgi:hypothetical protein